MRALREQLLETKLSVRPVHFTTENSRYRYLTAFPKDRAITGNYGMFEAADVHVIAPRPEPSRAQRQSPWRVPRRLRESRIPARSGRGSPRCKTAANTF